MDPHAALPRLMELAEEDPQLSIHWETRLAAIQVRLMGAIQAQILQELILRRFGWAVEFGPGRGCRPPPGRHSPAAGTPGRRL